VTLRNIISLILSCFVTNTITILSISSCSDGKFGISLKENRLKASENESSGENIRVYERERNRRIEEIGVYRSECRDMVYSVSFLRN
jgi:hypothetical protein